MLGRREKKTEHNVRGKLQRRDRNPLSLPSLKIFSSESGSQAEESERCCHTRKQECAFYFLPANLGTGYKSATEATEATEVL